MAKIEVAIFKNFQRLVFEEAEDSFEKIQENYRNHPGFYNDMKFEEVNLQIPDTNTFAILKEPIFLDPKCKLRGAGGTPFQMQHFRQGALGNCWFLAALAAVAKDEETVKFLFPEQNPEISSDSFSGAITLRLCFDGKWQSDVLDFKMLVTPDGSEIVGAQPPGEEDDLILWAPMLEKYLIKHYGSMNALEGGFLCEGMTLLTEGTTISSRNYQMGPIRLLNLITHCLHTGGYATCSTENSDRNKTNAGLILGHAYSISSVHFVKIGSDSNQYKQIFLKIANPHGRNVPTYPWAKKSDHRWRKLSDEAKREIDFDNLKPGEFWLTYQDFHRLYELTQVCFVHLPPCQPGLYLKENTRFQVFTLESQWEPGFSAGGANPRTFKHNPRLHFSVQNPDEGVQKACVWFRLIHKNQRNCPDDELFRYGFKVYRKDGENTPIDAQFLKQEPVLEMHPDFLSQVSGVEMLPVGHYVAIIYTEEKDIQAEFNFKVVVEHKACLCWRKNATNRNVEWVLDRLAKFSDPTEKEQVELRAAHDANLKIRRKNPIKFSDVQ